MMLQINCFLWHGSSIFLSPLSCQGIWMCLLTSRNNFVIYSYFSTLKISTNKLKTNGFRFSVLAIFIQQLSLWLIACLQGKNKRCIVKYKWCYVTGSVSCLCVWWVGELANIHVKLNMCSFQLASIHYVVDKRFF